MERKEPPGLLFFPEEEPERPCLFGVGRWAVTVEPEEADPGVDGPECLFDIGTRTLGEGGVEEDRIGADAGRLLIVGGPGRAQVRRALVLGVEDRVLEDVLAHAHDPIGLEPKRPHHLEGVAVEERDPPERTGKRRRPP